jgi:alkanesulfonate monooxygenase SsuD/methylene tetrahydromethanopterin reductase-like flavin-dependent oxidoreductase (luciferase family)
LNFGTAVESFTPPGVSPDTKAIFETATTAEALGFDTVWVWDHLLLGSRKVYQVLEPLTLLAAISSKTSRIKLGISTLVLPLRDPVVLAKEVQTIQHISNGRLLLGVAAGWYEKEFDAVGSNFSERGKKTEEYLSLLRKLVTETDINLKLGNRSFQHTTMEPRPSAPPKILMGGYKVLKRIGTMSDGWIASYYTPEDFRETWSEILRFARSAGRDEKSLISVNIVPVCVRNSFEEADKVARDFTAEYMDMPSWGKSKVESAVRGTVKDCVEQIKRYEQVGLQNLEFIPCYYDVETVETVGKEILPYFIRR